MADNSEHARATTHEENNVHFTIGLEDVHDNSRLSVDHSSVRDVRSKVQTYRMYQEKLVRFLSVLFGELNNLIHRRTSFSTLRHKLRYSLTKCHPSSKTTLKSPDLRTVLRGAKRGARYIPFQWLLTLKINLIQVFLLFCVFTYMHLYYLRSKNLYFNYRDMIEDMRPIRDYKADDLTSDDSLIVDTTEADDVKKSVKILCFAMTMEYSLETKAKSVNDTWGQRCDKLIFISSAPSNISNVITLNTPEGRAHLTTKTMSAIKYMYGHYLNDFDWFMKCDDDVYVIMENLKYMLSKYDPISDAVYLGNHFKVHVAQGYMSGGAGYVFSRKALKMMVEDAIVKGKCKNDGWEEDRDLGLCMEAAKVSPYSTIDKYGRETFHAFNSLNYIVGPAPIFMLQYPIRPLKTGKNCCSQLPISFHYSQPRMMYMLEYFFYRTTVYGRHHGPIPDDFYERSVSVIDKEPKEHVLVPWGNAVMLFNPETHLKEIKGAAGA